MLAGVTLAGRYRLDSKLGAGAMGEVWNAYDLRLSREVAVKVFPSHLDPEPRRVERFRAEAKLCGQLQHPGIVVVHDADEDNGQLFFVMELLHGKDLAKVMKEHRGGLPIGRVITIGARLAEALSAAHAKKVVHRDIKPANIMLLPGDRPKVCDFGIARVIEDGRATAQAGTPAYAAPEQSDGSPGERSDLYSMGCVLFEMTTGDRPFHGNIWHLVFQHATNEPRPPQEIRPEVPLPLSDLILQLLSKNPSDRPESATEVADRLRAMRPRSPKLIARSIDQLPPRQLLKSDTPERRHTGSDGNLAKEIDRILWEARVDARVAGYTRTPSLTLFEIRLGPVTPESAVLALFDRMALAANHRSARLVSMKRSSSPLPGVSAVGLEVQHAAPDLLSLGDLLREAPEGDHLLAGLGRAHDGAPAFLDLREWPHFLVAGNRGPFDPIKSIITSLAVRRSPKQLRLAMSTRDNPFTDLPHLIPQAVGEPLTWAISEIDCRYADLRKRQCRTTAQFNKEVRDSQSPVPIGALGDVNLAHPDVVVVIDELAKLEDPEPVVELAREGRAVGFHVIVRTEKPHVLSRRLKGYLPSRLALPMATAVESATVLDRAGAESLRPDEGLLVPGRGSEPYRIRLAMITDGEISEIVNHWQG
ncbi:DNA translocase FtsK [Nonomuraea endophytica]|uniref:non-specific serine/threonine protein kinase n=1 Tax=Nonomuraea endophytica TaxID=714136 RepID=A0A7W7ZXL0_9ACTN|nr:DNA translocase FtsK [Nonomuraea endophytica]MBB5075647.1 serine/threonine protein kinase [Nonomuraea endophytica]